MFDTFSIESISDTVKFTERLFNMICSTAPLFSDQWFERFDSVKQYRGTLESVSVPRMYIFMVNTICLIFVLKLPFD